MGRTTTITYSCACVSSYLSQRYVYRLTFSLHGYDGAHNHFVYTLYTYLVMRPTIAGGACEFFLSNHRSRQFYKVLLLYNSLYPCQTALHEPQACWSTYRRCGVYGDQVVFLLTSDGFSWQSQHKVYI